MGYPEYTVRHGTRPRSGNIAPLRGSARALELLNLLRFEQDTQLRSIFPTQLERSYEAIRIEQNPGTLRLRGVDKETIARLKRRESPPGMAVGPGGLVRIKTPTVLISANPPAMVATSAAAGRFCPRTPNRCAGTTGPCNPTAEPAAGTSPNLPDGCWPYWMGGYYGFIEAPQVTDPALARR